MFSFLLPKSAPFFEMLLEQNELLRHAAEQTVLLFGAEEKRYFVYKRVTEIEADADTLYRRISRSLSSTFITPIDREDILRISQSQEEVIDGYLSLASYVTSYSIGESLYPAQRTVDKIKAMLDLTKEMLEGLSRRHDCHKTRASRSLREECDSLLAVGMAELLDGEGPVERVELLSLLKWLQIYDRLQEIKKSVTDLSEQIEEAVMKNA